MNILYAIPGHLKTVPMGQFCADALEELGHCTTLFDFHGGILDAVQDKAQRLLHLPVREEKAAMNRRLRRVIDTVKPDIFLTLFGFDLSVETLAHLRRQSIPSACWWLNDPFQFQRSLQKAPYYDFLFTNSQGSVADYAAAGVRHAHFLPTACQPAVHRSMPPRPDYQCEVCFAGDYSALRESLVERIASKHQLKVFGPWGKKLKPDSPLRQCLVDGFFTPAEMATMFSSASVVLNVHTWHGKFDHGLNPRLFEASGCGAFQVVDWKQEIPALFDVQHELACWRNPDEMMDKIQTALAHPDQLKAAGQAAQKRAYAQHTYRHRLEELLKIMGF